MNNLKLILTFSIFTILFGCDCRYEVTGIILDNSTKKPLNNVAIGKTDTTDLENPFNRKTYSFKNGEFDVSGISGRCNQITLYFTKKDYSTQKVTFENGAHDTIFLKSNKKITFDPSENFEVINIKKNNSYPSSSNDKTICKNWNLTSNDIKTFIPDLKQIDISEWHHLFDQLPYNIDAQVIQDKNKFNISINGGSWLNIRMPDTLLYFGNYKEKNNKYFISEVWKENK